MVHLWAPWCSNCQAELKTGGWSKLIKDNPNIRFYFVSVWNSGDDGRAMLQNIMLRVEPNVTVLADSGSADGDGKIKQFLGSAVVLDSEHVDLQKLESCVLR